MSDYKPGDVANHPVLTDGLSKKRKQWIGALGSIVIFGLGIGTVTAVSNSNAANSPDGTQGMYAANGRDVGEALGCNNNVSVERRSAGDRFTTYFCWVDSGRARVDVYDDASAEVIGRSAYSRMDEQIRVANSIGLPSEPLHYFNRPGITVFAADYAPVAEIQRNMQGA